MYVCEFGENDEYSCGGKVGDVGRRGRSVKLASGLALPVAQQNKANTVESEVANEYTKIAPSVGDIPSELVGIVLGTGRIGTVSAHFVTARIRVVDITGTAVIEKVLHVGTAGLTRRCRKLDHIMIVTLDRLEG